MCNRTTTTTTPLPSFFFAAYILLPRTPIKRTTSSLVHSDFCLCDIPPSLNSMMTYLSLKFMSSNFLISITKLSRCIAISCCVIGVTPNSHILLPVIFRSDVMMFGNSTRVNNLYANIPHNSNTQLTSVDAETVSQTRSVNKSIYSVKIRHCTKNGVCRE